MKSRYDLMQQSKQQDPVTGKNYPDVLTIPLDQLTFDNPLTKVKINQTYKRRFYMIGYDNWGVAYYDDLLLWMNGISLEDTLEIGEEVLVPSLRDMNSYYSRNRITR